MAYYRKDQLSIKTRKLLADQLADIILLVQSIESFRLALAETEFFSGIQLFRFLDKDEKGYLTPNDFAKLVGGRAKKLLHYAFGWFDVSKAGQITRTQFLEFLFPRRHPQIRQILTERMTQQINQQIKSITLPTQLDLLRSLIQQIMQRQTKLVPVRRNLMQQEDYTIKAIMNCLDVDGRGWVTTGDFYKFLKNFDVDVSPVIVCEMLGVYDNDLNGRIQMQQLELLVQGLEKSGSSYRQIVRNSDKNAKQKLRRSRCTCYQNLMHKSAQKSQKKANKKQFKIFTAQKSSYEAEDQKIQKQTKGIKANVQRNQVQIKNENQKTPIKSDTINNKQNNKHKQPKQFSVSNKKKNKLKQGMVEGVEYQNLKQAFLLIQKQTEGIDLDLLQIEEQLKIKSQAWLREQLENAKMRRSMKQRQQQIIQKKMEHIERIRQMEQLKRLQHLQEARRLEMEKRKNLQLQLQKNRAIQRQKDRLHQLQLTRTKQIEFERLKLLHIEELRFKQAEQQRKRQAQQIELIQKGREKQLQLHAAMTRRSLQRQFFLRQMHANKQIDTPLVHARTQLDWNTQARLKTLHELDYDRTDLKQKQNDYLLRYSKYCNNLASVGDPLGIKEHIEKTDRFLMISRQIRDQIKRDRAYSLHRPTRIQDAQKQKQENKIKNQTKEFFDRTPQQNRDTIDTINKRTEQTKLMWT